MTIILNKNGNILTTFFEKAAKKSIFIHSSSNQPTSLKRAAIDAERQRIDNRCTSSDEQKVWQEKFNQKLLDCGYSKKFVEKKSPAPRTSRNKQGSPIYISVPFINDKFQSSLIKIFHTLDVPIRLVNRSTNTLRQALNKTNQPKKCNKRSCHINNDKLCFRQYVVYSITCSICSMDYVGSTTQYLHNRISQHHSSSKSAIYEHSRQHNAPPSFQYKVLQQCSSLKQLLFMEAIIIQNSKPSLNRHHELSDVIQFL